MGLGGAGTSPGSHSESVQAEWDLYPDPTHCSTHPMAPAYKFIHLINTS